MCLTKRLLSEPLLSVGTGVQEFNRYPSTVNRVLVSCSGVIGNSLLLVCHTERRPQSPCSMWEQELNRYPSIVNRQPSTVFKRQPGFQPAIDPELY